MQNLATLLLLASLPVAASTLAQQSTNAKNPKDRLRALSPFNTEERDRAKTDWWSNRLFHPRKDEEVSARWRRPADTWRRPGQEEMTATHAAADDLPIRILELSPDRLTVGAGPMHSFSGNVDTAWVRYYASGLVPVVDAATALAVDAAGSVYVTGWSKKPFRGSNYATVKYNAAGGQQWVTYYDGSENGTDEATALAVDAAGNVYVTGYSWGSGTDDDYATIKYNAAGEQQWVARYNGPGNSDDEATALAVDAAGNVYVTGWSVGAGSSYNYATIKYNAAGEEQWVARYNGPANSENYAEALAVDASGNVYVTGYSEIFEWRHIYTTIKYVQDTPVTVREREFAAPSSYALHQNHPNPFNPSTTIKYDLPGQFEVKLQIFDIAGRHVRTLVNQTQQAGRYAVIWDGRNERGKPVVSGTYFYQLRVDDPSAGSRRGFAQVRRMVLVR